MVIFPLAPDQTIAQMWSNGARGGHHTSEHQGVDAARCSLLHEVQGDKNINPTATALLEHMERAAFQASGLVPSRQAICSHAR